jgi:hypothetical protein
MLALFLHIYIFKTENKENTFDETGSFEKEFIEKTAEKLNFK